MNMRSTLWTLAFATAAMSWSCSDDVVNPNGGNGNGEQSGEKTYMKVAVNPGAVTRAAGGEEGDTPDGETGVKNEYTVKDVTVVLYRNAEGDNSDLKFKGTSVLVAAGYTTTPSMNITDEDWHKRMSTVAVTVTSAGEKFDGQTYGIIAVTNLGGETLKNRISDTDINTGTELANYLQKKAWSNDGASADNFIMSTHNDTYNNSNPIVDKVTLKANATAENAPEANVHVERLAAKVRINEDEQNAGFIYSVKQGTNTVAKVRLDKVAIINNLNSGSYLLKRVTTDVTGDSKEIPALPNEGDSYLGNENATNSSAGLNYVIDPWTRAKEAAKAASYNDIIAIDAATGITKAKADDATTLSYANPFTGDNYAALWNTVDGSAVQLAGNTALTQTNKQLFVAYAQENTTSAANSKKGYSTGALFKATYFPKEISKVVTADGKSEVKPQAVDYNGDTEGEGFDAIDANATIPENLKFYVYNGNAYDSYEAIFNEFAWRQQKSLNDVKDAVIYSYASFAADKITEIGVKAFFNSLVAEADDPMGYFAWLKKGYDLAQVGDDVKFTADKAISAFLADANETEALNKKINYYENCVMYYPYWIRHADNENSTDMGIMEFGIVRNNIYDLSVTGVGGYGASGVEKPNPGEDDESKTFLFNVQILVKNWVVRSNSGIIL